MKVIEIFSSIDGEGIRAGELATFIRLAGCNLRCNYCDTDYAWNCNTATEMTVDKIIDKCKEYAVKNITLTGGEPLIHKDVKQLIEALVSNGFYVNIETNGSVDIEPYIADNVLITMDYKTKTSGESEKMLLSNIQKLRETDVLKIVMGEDDCSEVMNILEDFTPKCYVYLSPIFGKMSPERVVNFLKSYCYFSENKLKIRMQLQMHKYIWGVYQRGV